MASVTVGKNEFHYIVQKNYLMDPNAEDLLYAGQLREGMKVLVDENGRYNVDADSYRVDHAYGPKIPITNRWCVVEKPVVVENTIYFIGVYATGEKHVRVSEPFQGWLVKKSSIPA